MWDLPSDVKCEINIHSFIYPLKFILPFGRERGQSAHNNPYGRSSDHSI